MEEGSLFSEEGSLFSCSLGTATHVLGMLGRAGVSSGLKHGPRLGGGRGPPPEEEEEEEEEEIY